MVLVNKRMRNQVVHLTTVSLPNVPGCPTISVDYCIFCDPTQASMEVTIVAIKDGCDPNLFDFYYDYAEAYLKANYDILCPGAWIPCDEEDDQVGNTVKIKEPICWYFDDSDPVNFYFCNASYCVQTYKVCAILGGGTKWTLVSTAIEGANGCPGREFPDECDAFECGRSHTACDRI